MRRFILIYYGVVSTVFPAGGIALALASTASDAFAAGHCSRYCHNRGCPHSPLLPDWLTGDAGLFGKTVDALHAMGDRFAAVDLSGSEGYGLVNLLLFCGLIPAFHLGFLALSFWLADQ
jgi:hypothetical protein